MDILILGGGVFLGAAALQSALARGHRVSVFNRGRARSDWPPGVEAIVGNRSAELSALQGRRWDAVIDTCGYVPVDVRLSCATLIESGRYLFVSSVSVYASTRHAPLRETDALAAFDAIAEDDRDLQHYGAQKAACEAEVTRAFGERALLVRPGLIVGAGDRSGRFSHWPWRVRGGGKMLVPDVPADEPLQFIDVRDLADWLVTLIEQGASGAVNATGPLPASPRVDWQRLLRVCDEAARARGVVPARPVAVSESFLLEQGVAPWTELPLWLPSTNADYAGFNRVDLGRAAAAGLHTRPLHETIDAVMDEALPAADDRRRAGKLDGEREARLLQQWCAA